MNKTRNLSKIKNVILRALVILGPIFLINNIKSYSFNSSDEKILKFDSVIKVLQDGSLDVTEKITVNAQGMQIKRGILREFPTKYKDSYNNKYNVKFELKSVLKDGNPEQYNQVTKNNGIYIYIGNPEIYLTPGVYTYEINYKTNRQLGYFENFDELYWNATGNGWRLPIEHATATVILPDNIAHDKIKFEAYTGKFGAKEQDYTAELAPKNNLNPAVIFKTTKELAPGQGLTIVVSWPKGFIKEPGYFQKLIWLLQDNLNVLIILLGLLLVLILGIFWVINFRKTQEYKTVIPLFEPPANLSPAAVRYISQKKYDNKVFAAMIVDLAVKGYLKIKYEPGTWIAGEYTLIKIKDIDNNLDNNISREYIVAFRRLFKNSDSIRISKTNSEYISEAVNACSESLYRNYNYDNFNFNSEKTLALWVLGITSIIVSFFISSESFILPFMAALIVFFCFIFSYFLSGYTPEGISIMEKIEGFKLFLVTTEEERLKVIGTPPDKNPELYEKYLPYAIALGVEKQWSSQFAPIFEQLKKQGATYIPAWYIGAGPNFIFQPDSLASSISDSVSANISSSDSRPGGSSGSGGSGSSGGGGGGGGGGGW